MLTLVAGECWYSKYIEKGNNNIPDELKMIYNMEKNKCSQHKK